MIRSALTAAVLLLACVGRGDAMPPQVAPPAPVAPASVPPAPVVPPRALAPIARPDPLAPPAPWAPQDPADSLYTAAREALARSDFRRAAELFHRIPERYPSSTYAGDALYWEAFALYRLGSDDDLRRAVTLLQRQAAGYPNAATRADAQTLLVRINGALAQRGDLDAAAAVAAKAASAAERAVDTERLAAEMREAANALRNVSLRFDHENRRDEARDPSCPEDPDREVRIAALNALMQLDAESALPILNRVLERDDPCSADLRRSAVFVVSRTRSPEAEAILIKSARDDPDTGVRERAVRSLANIDTETAVAALGEILETSNDGEVQAAAIFALSRQKSEYAGNILRDFAGREDMAPGLREQAIRAIGRRGTAEDLRYLRDLFSRSSGKTKEWALEALASADDEETARWLLAVARNGAEPLELRRTAIYRAATGGTPIEQVVALYDEVQERELKSSLISAFARRSEPLAVDKLIDIVRRETDIELRRRAITALARSGDPRVAQVLLEIIGT